MPAVPAPAAPPVRRPDRRARVAVLVTFAVHGVVFASWTPRIPTIKAELGLGDAQLGLALLGPALGSLLAMVAAGVLSARYGSRVVTRVSTVAYCLSPGLVGLADSLPALFGALAVWGAGLGALDVAMNVQAVEVEHYYPRPIMSSFHGLWSVGALGGAGLGALLAAQDVDVTLSLAATGLAGLAVAAVAMPALLPAPGVAGPVLARPSRRLAGLGVIAFAALLCEGAAADWGAVYLRDVLTTSAGAAGAAYGAFALTMAAGRLTGDRVVARFGAGRTVRVAAGLAAGVFGAALLVGRPWAAVVGFAALGLGLACIVPVVFTAAGRVGDTGAGPALAAVSTCGYFGFLVGAPLIGGVSEVVSLPVALGLVAVLTAAIAVVAPTVDRVPAAPVRAPAT